MQVRIILVLIFAFAIFGCNAGNVKDSSVSNVKSDEISVVPDSKVIAIIEISDGKISSVKAGSGDADAVDEGTIAFSLSEMDENGMMLSLQSTLGVTVKFDIEMVDYRGKRHYTSSCPIMPGRRLLEIWWHKIPELKISNFRVLSDTSNMACE